MNIVIKKDYILIESEFLVKWNGWLMTGQKTAKAAALFPFLMIRSKDFTPQWLIDHELIHFRQQIETLFIGALLISLIERLYAGLFLGMNKFERNLYAAIEQEAYLNMHNPDYLQTRKWWSLFHYICNKRKFTLTGPGELKFLD